jgi:DNA-binding MarR family transcriptional regulator
MSTAIHKKTSRRELLNQLVELGRRISTQTVFLHQAIAQTVGLNATDTKCIDLILSHPERTMTAGELSERTGLTTGAITHIVDRLEKRRFVTRIRDRQDRRKVLVQVRLKSLEPLIPKYEEVGKAYMALAEEYSDDDLAVICDYMGRASAISEQEVANVVQHWRDRSGSKPHD